MTVLLSEVRVYLHFTSVCFFSMVSCVAASEPSGALTLPSISGDLTTMEGLHSALAPAWESLVVDRNSAGLGRPENEGKPLPSMTKQQTMHQYKKVKEGQTDSARLLLVYGMVPSTGDIDEETKKMFLQEGDEERKKASEEAPADGEEGAEKSDTQSNLPAIVDPNQVYPDGSTPLHMAATFGLAGSARALLDAGADVHRAAKTGVKPIHGAAIMGHVALIELLVEGRADIDAAHGFAGNTAMHFAAEMGHTEVVRRLCELGADVEAAKHNGGTPLHITADTNNSEVTRVLVHEPCNADPEALVSGEAVALYIAAGRGFPKVIDVLLEAGANPDRSLWQRPGRKKKEKKDPVLEIITGEKPVPTGATIAQASTENFPDSDPNSLEWKEANGATSLHNAAENGHARACQALLDGGARQLSVMKGATPLIQAIHYKHPDVAMLLLNHKTPANVASLDKDGRTALHHAVIADYPDVAASILRQGGPHQIKDDNGTGSQAIDYAYGQQDHGAETRWLLSKFVGREPKLDLIVQRASRPGGEKAKSLEKQLSGASLEGINKDIHELYVEYALLKAGKMLEQQIGHMMLELGTNDLHARMRGTLTQSLNVAKFVLLGNDAYIAAEAMDAAMESNDIKFMRMGLALLGIKAKTLEFEQDKGVMRISGHNVFKRVNTALERLKAKSQKKKKAASRFQGGDWQYFLNEMDRLSQDAENDFVRRVAKAGVSSPSGEGATEKGDDVEDHLEL